VEIKRGRYRGKKITFASSSRVDELREIADEFMFEVFDFSAGEYLISDESSLLDFTEMGSADVSSIWQRIEDHYGIRAKDLSSDKLVDIFSEISGRRNPH